MKGSSMGIGTTACICGRWKGVARFNVKHCLAVMAILFVAGINGSCGGGYGGGNSSSPGGGGITASITNSVSTVQEGMTYTFNATTPSSYGYTAGITWSLSPATGAGTLSNAMNNGFSSSVVYQAPTTQPNPNSVTITATPSDMRVGAAKDTFTIAASAMAMMAGQFAVEFSGADPSGGTVEAAGSFMADGAGNITGGSMDVNHNRASSVHVAAVTGSYTLDSSMHGSITLAGISGSDRPLAFSFMLASDRQSGAIGGPGANGAAFSGLLLRQDRTAFALSKISSDFVFKLEANAADRLATVGKLSIAGNSAISGIADESKSGLDPVLSAARITGRLTAAPDADGRGSFTLATPAGNSSFVFYVASDSRLLLMETDTGGAARTRQLGLAERQTLPFSAKTADAVGRLKGSGFDTQASSFGAVSVTGSLAIQNLTHATLSWDARSAVATVSIDSQRSEQVAFDPSTGRGTVEIANGVANNFADSIAFYLASPGKGFFLDRTAGRFNRAIAGDLETVAEK